MSYIVCSIVLFVLLFGQGLGTDTENHCSNFKQERLKTENQVFTKSLEGLLRMDCCLRNWRGLEELRLQRGCPCLSSLVIVSPSYIVT